MSAEPAPDPVAGDGQRYESVLVRILLNEDGSIRRMTARHVRTGTERHWPTLDRAALPYGSTPVTLNLDDAPFEVLVKILAYQAGLKQIRVGNVIMVTTKENAAEFLR